MTIQTSTAVANARLDAVETVIGASPLLRVYAGSVPADCAASIGAATLLVEMALASDWLDAATVGRKVRQGTWSEAAATATGTASFFRIYDSTGVTCHMQGSVSAAGGGGNLAFNSISFVAGYYVGVPSFVLRAPEGPAFAGTLARTLAAATISAAGTVVTPSISSTHFDGTNPVTRGTAPATNYTLLTGWFRRTADMASYPVGDLKTPHAYIGGTYGFIQAKFGGYDWPTATTGTLNTGWELFCDPGAAGSGFHLDLDTGAGALPASVGNGWIFVAFLMRWDGTNVYIDHWVKPGPSGTLSGPNTQTMTIAAIRTATGIGTWNPTVAGNFEIGNAAKDYACWRVYEVTAQPSNATIDAIAALGITADTTAWADWSLEYSAGVVTTDRSGNGRLLSAGTGYTQGRPIPA